MGISIGMVGLGSFGSGFVDMFKTHPLVDRIALCDRESERVAKFAQRPDFQDKFDPKDAYSSLEDLCKSDIDAVVIITQHWLHTPQAITALEAGKCVYAAVPLLSVPDGDEILDACDKLIDTVRRTGMHYMYGETTYYRPEAMYCRRRAAEGAFGEFVYAEGEYFHDVDLPSCNLREVHKNRLDSAAGREWQEMLKGYNERGIIGSAMHYPTHSTSGPISVMNAHMTKVCAWGQPDTTGDDFFAHSIPNETALFEMSNGATARICEFRQIGHTGSETFRIFGTKGSFKEKQWIDKEKAAPLTVSEMRDPLPDEVVEAWTKTSKTTDFYGGHGGSHGYLVNEFVDAVASDRTPVINAWEAVRYTAAGVMAHKSALKGGEVLEVPDWGDAPS